MWFIFWECSLKFFWNVGLSLLFVWCLWCAWHHWCLIPFFSFLHTHRHTHTKVSTPLLWLSQSLTLSLCLPVWVEFNRVLWCERDVSLKNIRHQRSLLRWSGISSCAHSAHSLDLVSFLWYHKAIPKCQTAKENENLNSVTVIILKFSNHRWVKCGLNGSGGQSVPKQNS